MYLDTYSIRVLYRDIVRGKENLVGLGYTYIMGHTE